MTDSTEILQAQLRQDSGKRLAEQRGFDDAAAGRPVDHVWEWSPDYHVGRWMHGAGYSRPVLQGS